MHFQGGTSTCRSLWKELTGTPPKFLVPMSDGFSGPGIFQGWIVPSILACLTKWTLLCMCLVFFESFLFFYMAMALEESTKSAIVKGESACKLWNLLNTWITCIPMMVANAQALYSAWALDMAIGVGTNKAGPTETSESTFRLPSQMTS